MRSQQRFMRREFLRLTAAALAASNSGAVWASDLPIREDLNILFLMGDQWHHGVLSCAGHPLVKTPNLDGLAKQGARFTQAVCTTPYCQPTRASLLTGKYPHHFQVQGPNWQADDRWGITENLLRDAGFAAHYRGKWHLGDRRQLRAYADDLAPPAAPGLHLRKEDVDSPGTVRGRKVQMIPALQHADAAWRQYLSRRAASPYHFDNMTIGKTDLPKERSPEWMLTDQALGLLGRCAQSKKNFMLTVSWVAPHSPWVAPEPFYSMYRRDAVELPANANACPAAYENALARQFFKMLGDEGLREWLAVYYGLCTLVDDCVGRLLAALHQLGLQQKTLILFISDHGDMQGELGMADKLVDAFFEGIVRVPLIFWYPPAIRHGQTPDVCTDSTDIMPTLLDYAGLPAPGDMDGQSLRPFMEGKPDDGRAGFCQQSTGRRMIRTREWKYVWRANGRGELFDLRNDPGEVKNLIAAPHAAEARSRLHLELRTWMLRTRDPLLDKMAEKV